VGEAHVGAEELDHRAERRAGGAEAADVALQVAALRRLWAGGPAVPGTAPIGPRPVQPGGPPLWAAASGRRPLERAAHWADGLAGFDLGPDPAAVERVFRLAVEAWQHAGRAERPWLATSFWYALGPDARKRLDAYVERYLAVFGRAAVEALKPRCLAAGDAAVRDAIRAVREAGADELILVPTGAEAEQLERLLDLVG
jgi:alkanesulfonate monooxygenase SsuD/methylene tetrahydromethanopterin reductase-like flavin-dependent oxidoreductase (luciferase family)